MKQIVFATVSTGIIICVIVAVFTIASPSIRQHMLENDLRDSAYEALDTAVKRGMDDRGLMTLFQQLFLVRAGDDRTAGDIWISIREADVKKGILSCSAGYDHKKPNGKTVEISGGTTVILEQEAPKDTVTYRYYITWEKAKELDLPYVYGKNSLYQEIEREAGAPEPVITGIKKEDIVEVRVNDGKKD